MKRRKGTGSLFQSHCVHFSFADQHFSEKYERNADNSNSARQYARDNLLILSRPTCQIIPSSLFTALIPAIRLTPRIAMVPTSQRWNRNGALVVSRGCSDHNGDHRLRWWPNGEDAMSTAERIFKEAQKLPDTGAACLDRQSGRPVCGVGKRELAAYLWLRWRGCRPH